MHNIANYDVTATCGYVGCPLNGFKNLLAPLNQNLLMSKSVFFVLGSFNCCCAMKFILLKGMHKIQFTGQCIFSACIFKNFCGFKG